MNEAEIYDEADTLPVAVTMDVSQSLAVGLTRAEIDQQISTARAYPRSYKSVATRIMSLATLDEESAEECLYALPRGGKPIKGPSIRFAEILKQSFGNCRSAARVVHVDRIEMYVEAEGIFHDLETNSATSSRVRRRISDKRGRLFNDDMIIVTGNAACSIAQRNAILAGVPKPLWRKAYDAVQSAIAGDITTLSENRGKAIKAFALYGVTPELVFKALGVVGEEDITVDHITVLRGMFATLKNGEATVEEMFGSTVTKSAHEKVDNPLDDTPATGGETSDPVTGEIIETAEARPAPQAASVQTAGSAPPPSDPAVDRLAELSTELDDDLGEATSAEAVEAKVTQFKIDHPDMTDAEKKALGPIKKRHLERVAAAPPVVETKAPAADPDGLDEEVPDESLETEG